MKDFFKQLFRGSGDEIDNYEYNNAEDIILKCSELRSDKRHSDAIRLYEKFTDEIMESDYEIVGLTTIIKICQENFDTPRMVSYANRLKSIAPDHPWVTELSKYYLV